MKTQKSGQAALIAVILMLVLMLSAVFATSAVALKDAKVAEESRKARLAYFAAESGVDDAVYRSLNGKTLGSSFTISLNGATATITVTTSGAFTIIKDIKSTGDFSGANRATESTLSNTTGVSFNYGVQVGDGGLTMGSGSKVSGDVFSNGSIAGVDSSHSRITGNAQAAGNSSITKVRANNGASAHSFDNCIVDGAAKYVSSFTNCTASSTQILSQNITPQNFPISQAQIDAWKNDACPGGAGSCTINGNYTVSGSQSLGPKKINGNLKVDGGATLTVTGTIWVTGKFETENNTAVKLSAAYGSSSGILIADDTVDISNNTAFSGSGTSGSYIMVLTTKNAPASQVMDISNNTTGVIYYAGSGRIHFNENAAGKEATAYGIDLDNNTTITYESGLADKIFSSGPTGGWNITNWQEIIP